MKHGAGGASRGASTGGGKLDGCIMHQVHTSYLQYERALKIFYIHNFEYFQIWLNIFMNDCHLNITKLK